MTSRGVLSHLQRAAAHTAQASLQEAYRAYLDHTAACATCGPGETRCAAGQRLWQQYQAIGS